MSTSRFITCKWLAVLAAAGIPCVAEAARASTVTFAAFSDTAPNQWTYSGGALTAATATANFVSFGAPNQRLNYTGAVTYDLHAIAVAPAVNNGGVISQAINGEMTFRNGSTTILDVSFAGAVITGIAGSNSTGVLADTQITGNVIAYSSSPGVQVGTFIEPLSFSIVLTQIPGMGITGSSLSNFAATASGSFSSNDGSGAGSPEPASLALLGVGGLALLRRRSLR